MERRQKVELFEQIRREYEFGCGTISGTAQRFGVHRRMVRQAIESAIPPERKRPERQRPVFDTVREFIDNILAEDRRAPRKQRHTAHRIFARLRDEMPEIKVAERSVRCYVRERRQSLGLVPRQVMIPQVYDWGVEAQVDWYEAVVELDDERVTLQFFCLRSMASGLAFHRAYERATQQAFLEAHTLAFSRFGGVFQRLRYDNLKSAVKRVLRGTRREECVRFIAFRSHYCYEASFCTPAQGHEKGGVEGEVGRFRRNHLVPIPRFRDLEELNAYLDEACQKDQSRHVDGRERTVGEAHEIEQAHLLPLPREPFEIAEESLAVVDQKGCVHARTNWYSTPLKPGIRCRVRVLPSTVEVWLGGRCVAQHPRCYLKRQQFFDLEHYLDVLERKPGALAGSKPLAQWRREGRWTPAYDELWQCLEQRHGSQAGTRLMIELLQEGRRTGYRRLSAAITEALRLGTRSVEAVRYLLRHEVEALPAEGAHECLLMEEVPAKAAAYFHRPQPSLSGYDTLLEQHGVTEVAR
jgi:transposase